ncbi:hypothetical protein BDW42DRAFT_150435 [Aspergillus taichungensis]|uniref:Uncharacterized protein n=1 Tax=Aspergillus taichungensis TaxID=482145 RepID=A0A2J5I6G6_9EURO|nr:hypothetical protein BDW42DRAFT_150435 [Aspergillus taichungensis]
MPRCSGGIEALGECGMGNLEARMKDGSLDWSEGSGGRQTKCRISAEEVPIYRLSSVVALSDQSRPPGGENNSLQYSTQVIRTSSSEPSADSGTCSKRDRNR